MLITAGAVVGGILALCLACVVGSAVLTATGVLPTSTPKPTATTVAAAQFTPTAPTTPSPTTNTPPPTATSVPPTATTQAPTTVAAAPAAAPTATPRPTNTPLPPTAIAPPSFTPPAPTATSVPVAPVAQSGGLGLGDSEWERTYGKGNPSNANRNYLTYRNGAYAVNFEYIDRTRFSGPRRAARIERSWGPDAVSLEAARAESKQLIPSDAQLVRTYISEDLGSKGKTVDLYTSEWLKSQLPIELWNFHRVDPGTLAVVYDLNLERLVDRRNGRPFDAKIVVGIGKNP